MISVVVPLKLGETFKKTFIREDELILETRGEHPATARNLGALRAKGDFLLFLDSDMDLLGLDVQEIPRLMVEKRLDLATAYYDTPILADKVNVAFQNLQATLGLPGAFIGGFIACRRHVWESLRGFRKVPYEDIDYAWRAWVKGYKLGALPFTVVHTRPFSHRDLFRVWESVVDGMAQKAVSRVYD